MGAGKLLLGYHPATKTWIPLQVDANGKVVVDMSAINLDDLGDVDIVAVADSDLLFYDNVTGLWINDKLIDSDIPAGIARDAEVIAAIADHADDTTGVHGAGANHLALFGVASTKVSKFTPKVTATPLFRNHQVENSSFEALINGNPTSTSVVYDNDVREDSLPDTITWAQWGKVILYNITRGNSRKITGVNTATNTLTTEASVDDWANNDIITIGSQTADFKDGYSYSRLFDINISDEVPATATVALLYLSTRNLSNTAALGQDLSAYHPFETYSIAKLSGQLCTAAYQSQTVYHVIPITAQKICLGFGLYADVTASGMQVVAQLRGYWE